MLDVSARELEYVIAVARDRSFTQAARRLHMAQPALSQAIIRLERRLGVRLFDRTSRHVAPTAAGETLARDAEDVVARIRAAVERARSAPTSSHRVHIGEPSLETPRRLLFAIRAGNPRISIHQTSLPAELVLDELRDGRLSLSIGEPIHADGIHCVAIRSERVGVLVARGHPLAELADSGDGAVTPEAVADYPLVSIDDRLSQWNTWIARMFAAHGQQPRWTASSVFGVAAGSDMTMGDEAVLVSLESVGAEASSDFRWLPLNPETSTRWFVNWPESLDGSADIQSILDAAKGFARASGW